MLSQTGPAEMKLMDFALHHRSFASAQIATAANPLVGSSSLFARVPGCDSGLHEPGFRINASGRYQGSQGELACSELQHIRIRMLAERAG